MLNETSNSTTDDSSQDNDVTRDKTIDTSRPDGIAQLNYDKNYEPETKHDEKPVNTSSSHPTEVHGNLNGVTSNLNKVIRHTGCSAKELFLSHNQNTGINININNSNISDRQCSAHTASHKSPALNKAGGAHPIKLPNLKPGNTNKSSALNKAGGADPIKSPNHNPDDTSKSSYHNKTLGTYPMLSNPKPGDTVYIKSESQLNEELWGELPFVSKAHQPPATTQYYSPTRCVDDDLVSDKANHTNVSNHESNNAETKNGNTAHY